MYRSHARTPYNSRSSERALRQIFLRKRKPQNSTTQKYPVREDGMAGNGEAVKNTHRQFGKTCQNVADEKWMSMSVTCEKILLFRAFVTSAREWRIVFSFSKEKRHLQRSKSYEPCLSWVWKLWTVVFIVFVLENPSTRLRNCAGPPINSFLFSTRAW